MDVPGIAAVASVKKLDGDAIDVTYSVDLALCPSLAGLKTGENDGVETKPTAAIPRHAATPLT
jgi:hypothetical protein